MIAHTNLHAVYYRFKHRGQNYWILGQNIKYNLKALEGNKKSLERIIKIGEKMIGHSKYDEKSRHFDCSSFMNYLFTKAGHHLGSTTFSQCYNGKPVNYKNKKRGDLIFFDDKDDGHLAHVGMYLGKELFLHDNPYTDNGGLEFPAYKISSGTHAVQSIYQFTILMVLSEELCKKIIKSL